MKTIKNILYALFAVAALAMVGCVKDQTYIDGGDLVGAQIYIDNSTSVFYVQTAEEKEEEAKELKALNSVYPLAASYTDDKYVDVKLVRKSSTAEQLDFEVSLVMDAEDAETFTLPQGAQQTGALQAEEKVIFTVPCSFAAEAAETNFRIGFDIAELSDNYEYEFKLELVDPAMGTMYGSNAFEFALCHSIVVELPFEDIGTVTMDDPIYTGAAYSDCVIQIHKDDKKAIEDARAAGTAPKLTTGYVRFFIPHYWYQIAAASVAAGDGNFEEDDLEYFAQGDGLMLCMTPEYEPVAQDGNATHFHPMEESADKPVYPKTYPIQPIAGIRMTDGAVRGIVGTAPTERMYLARVPFINEGYEYFLTTFFPQYGFGTTTRTMNTYSYGTAAWEPYTTGSLYILPMTVTWDKNDLEDDWANYFKIDYNNDINLSPIGVGVFTSEYQDKFSTQTLYKGYDDVYGQTVYYIADAYETETEDTGYLGLAMTWNGTTASLPEMQPLNMQWNGRELYASQSQEVKSAIEFNEDGGIKKITFGVAIVNEEGQVLGNYTETFDMEANPTGLDEFLGEWMQMTYELYGPYDPQNPSGSIMKAFLPLMSSSVVIEQAVDNTGAPIKNKVKVKGLIPDNYTILPGGYLEGTYDPSTNTIDIPEQFFHDLSWPGEALGLAGTTIFPYFQPCMTDYGAYNTSKGPMWMSEIGAEAGSIALHYSNGMLEMASSTNDAAAADGYSIILGYYDEDYDEFVVDADNMAFFTTISFPAFGVYNPTFIPASAGGGVMPLSQQKFVKKNSREVNAIEAFGERKARGEKLQIANKIAK